MDKPTMQEMKTALREAISALVDHCVGGFADKQHPTKLELENSVNRITAELSKQAEIPTKDLVVNFMWLHYLHEKSIMDK